MVIGASASERALAIIHYLLLLAVALFTLSIVMACVVVRFQVEGVIRDVIFQLALLSGSYAIFALFAGVSLLFRPGRRRAGLVLVLLSMFPIPIFLLAVGCGH